MKELFYTLENVQVDADELDKDMFRDVVKIYNNNNFVFDDYKDESLNYLSSVDNKLIFSRHRDKKTTITYEKFMELFAPQYEVKMIVEAPSDFKQITDSIASLLQYKNEKYGNSALEPLNVFQGKCKVGQRLDDKLARVKNNTTLQKNDVSDLIGYLFLVCKENNWTNFDEFKD